MCFRRALSLVFPVLVVAIVLLPRVASAEPAASVSSGDGGEKVAAAKLAGDNAWMLTASALVLLMTAPGLAMFYGGLVRKKNVLGVMTQCVFLMGLNSVIWALYGYSLVFGGAADSQSSGVSPWIGNGDFLLMRNVQPNWDEANHKPVQSYFRDAESDVRLPRLTHMLFEGMFFIITPALICGAFAERMKFSTMIVFTILWGTLVYCPLAHCVWGGGCWRLAQPAHKS